MVVRRLHGENEPQPARRRRRGRRAPGRCCQRACRSARRTKSGRAAALERRGRRCRSPPASPARCRGSRCCREQVGIEARVGELDAVARARARPAGLGLASERLRGPNRCASTGSASSSPRSLAGVSTSLRLVARSSDSDASSGGAGSDDHSAGGGARLATSGSTGSSCHSAGASRPRSKSPSRALKTALQRPQRTQPSETLSWSWTTRNAVPQEVQRVARLIAKSCHAASARIACRRGGSSRRPRRRRRERATAHRQRAVRRPGARGCRPAPAGRRASTSADSSGASSLSGVARMLASTSWYGRDGVVRQCRRASSTPLASAFAARRFDRGRVDVDRIDVARAEAARARSRGCRSRSRSRARAARPCRRAAVLAIQRRHMRVVGCVPVPKARPGSSRITSRASAGRRARWARSRTPA